MKTVLILAVIVELRNKKRLNLVKINILSSYSNSLSSYSSSHEKLCTSYRTSLVVANLGLYDNNSSCKGLRKLQSTGSFTVNLWALGEEGRFVWTTSVGDKESFRKSWNWLGPYVFPSRATEDTIRLLGWGAQGTGLSTYSNRAKSQNKCYHTNLNRLTI